MLLLSVGHRDAVVLAYGGRYVMLCCELSSGNQPPSKRIRLRIIGPKGIPFLREELTDDLDLQTTSASEIGHLCLGRKVGEAVVIGNWGWVEVKERRGKKVKLSFGLADPVKVMREKVWLETHASLPYTWPE